VYGGLSGEILGGTRKTVVRVWDKKISYEKVSEKRSITQGEFEDAERVGGGDGRRAPEHFRGGSNLSKQQRV